MKFRNALNSAEKLWDNSIYEYHLTYDKTIHYQAMPDLFLPFCAAFFL